MNKMILVILFISGTGNAHALHAPSPTQLKALQTQIAAIHTLQASITTLAQKIKDENELIDPSQSKIDRLQRQLAVYEAQLSPLCNQLIKDTYADYGIKPHRYSGEIVLPGDLEKTQSSWKPKFGTIEHERRVLNGAGHDVIMGQQEDYEAITWANGDIFITITAFRFSPGYLAAIISHETIHFDQITTKGVGDKTTVLERERRAFNQARGTALKSVFNLTNDESTAVEAAFDKALKTASTSRNSMVIGASGMESVDLTENPNGEDIFRQRIEEAKALAEESRQRVEQERRREINQRLQISYMEIAKRSCESPGSVSQAELDVLPSSREMEDRSTPEGLSPCEREIYQGLMNGANADDLIRYATPVVPAQPSITYPPLPQPPVAYVPAVVSKSLGEILPGLKEFAEMACKYGGHIPAPKGFFAPRQPYAVTSIDDAAADKMKAGLGRCESHVFGRLYEALRDGRGDLITEQWFVDAVASTPAQIIPPANNGGFFPPPQNGDGGRNPCEVNGDPFGCQPRR